VGGSEAAVTPATAARSCVSIGVLMTCKAALLSCSRCFSRAMPAAALLERLIASLSRPDSTCPGVCCALLLLRLAVVKATAASAAAAAVADVVCILCTLLPPPELAPADAAAVGAAQS
jgi:hypothetical protein